MLTARTLGATRWDAWWSITAAQSGPMVLSASALGFAAAWGQCGAMLVLMGALQPHDGQPGSSALAVLRTGTVGQDLAWLLILASVAVAVAAMLTSEWARQRWRRRALPPRARGIAT